MYLKDTDESLTRIGPRTPMGDVLRRFWVPALLAHELPGRYDAPVEVRLFGEDLVVELDAEGELAITDRYFKEMAAYPVVQSGGIAWTYMGPHHFKPQLPVFPWSALPPLHRATSKQIEAGNWARAIEKRLTADSRFMPPFYTSPSPEHGRAHVPIDDAHTLVWSFGANAKAGAADAGEPDEEAIAEFHHLMVGLARDVARGHAPEAASHGEWYSQRPFPI